MTDSIDIRSISKKKTINTGPDNPDDGQSGSSLWKFLQKDIQIISPGLPDKMKESFYLELCTLLAAGMDIRASLKLIKEEQTKKRYEDIFDRILRKVVEGDTLSHSLDPGKGFTAYEIHSVHIGEETGKLVAVLGELALYYKKKNDQKRQIIGAITYPIIVIVVAICAIAFMMAYVVPMFSDILKRFGGDLPFITRLVLYISGAVSKLAPLIALLSTTVVVVLLSQRKKPWVSKWTAILLLRIPLIGRIVQKIYLARFANTMSLLIGARIPLLQALQLVKKMVNFYPIESSLTDIENNVLSGISLYESLAHHSIYPKKMIALIKVGEEVNQTDVFFDKIAKQYSNEVEYQTTMLSKFIEPLIIVILGLIVGTILIAMYLPLFKLGQSF